MLFERIEMVNFASYYGEHTVDLETTADKPVIIILGGTGHGKTTIFDAINWALYGTDYERALIKRRQRKIEDYVNQKALREAHEKNETAEMSCTLFFEHSGVHYYITHSICVRPSKNNKDELVPIPTDSMTALYQITHRGDHIHKEYDTIFLDEILPSNVKDYFLFDGDRIYQLSNPGSSQEVRDAIYRVVDLELLKKAAGHLNDVATEYRRGAKKHSPDESSSVEGDYAAEHEKLSRLKKFLSNYKEEERVLIDQIDVLEEKLSGLPDTSKLQAKRQGIKNQLSQTDEQKEARLVEMRKYCASSSLALAREPMFALITELDSRRQKGLIPRNVSKSLLNDLLEMRKCVCGTEFNDGDEIYLRLKKRLEEESNRSSGQEFIDLLFQIRTASDNVDDSIVRLKEIYSDYKRLSDYYTELNIALKQVDLELEKLPKDDITVITNELRERRNALLSVGKNITLTSVRIEESEKEIDRLKNLRVQLGKKQSEFLMLQRREYLAQQTANELERIYEIFAEDSRKSIEELTRDGFKQFVQTAAAYDVALDENYELLVLDPNGNRALQRLSMGQSQCLSLSFITAISRVSEKNPPLVIDMPFGRLDRDVHDAVSQRLPQLTSQLILFLIPEIEWNEVTAKNLKPKAAHIYRLHFDPDSQTTEIVNE